MKRHYTFILALILTMLPASHAVAHKVIIFAWVEDGMIYTESSFGSKRMAKDCAITVVDENGRVVHTGRTDHDGKYAFEIPEDIESDLVLKLTAGTGHQGQWRIPENELKTLSSAADIQAVMVEKEKLEQHPSVFKVIGGIGIIFLMALIVKYLKRKTS